MQKLNSSKLSLYLLLVLLSWAWEGLSTSYAQTVTYLWADSLRISTTGRDSLFATPWEQVVIYVDGADAYVKWGSPDTTGWSSRSFMLLKQGATLSFGPGTKLKRLQYKAASSGTVTLYFAGSKKKAQF